MGTKLPYCDETANLIETGYCDNELTNCVNLSDNDNDIRYRTYSDVFYETECDISKQTKCNIYCDCLEFSSEN